MPDRVRLSYLLASTILQSAILAGGAAAQDASTSSNALDGSTLETITVTSGEAEQNDKHQGAADRANSIYISRDQIELNDPQNARDLFAGDASVQVGGGNAISQKVHVNGVVDANLAVSIDGVLQGNRVFHHTADNYIDPTLLKSVRVDPSVAPADAGFGALAGSIVYETVDVADLVLNGRSFGAFADVSYTTNGETFTGSTAAYAMSNGFEVLGYLRGANGVDYKDGNGNDVFASGEDFYSALSKTAYETETGYRFEVSGQYVSDAAERPFRANLQTVNGTYVSRIYDTTRQNYAINFGKDTVSGVWNPVVVAGYSENDFKVVDPWGSMATVGTWSGKAENVFELSEGNTITGGLDFLSQQADYTDDFDGDLDESVANVGAYVQARIRPYERLSLSLGGRADSNHFTGKDGTDLDNFGFSGNAFAEIAVGGGFSVNAGYSNVFGGIDLEETFEFWRAMDYSNLKPLRSDNVTAGIKYQNNGWFAEGNVFNTRFWNFRDIDQNIDLSSYGFNLAGGYNWGNGFARISYSNTDVANPDGTSESYYVQDFGSQVGQVISAEVAHTFEEYDVTLGGTLDAALEYGGFEKHGLATLDPYLVVNAYAEYNPKRFEALTVRFEANNIFDENYIARGTYGAEYVDVGLVPNYEPGRSFRLAAKLRY